jgi:hypothetical protein
VTSKTVKLKVAVLLLSAQFVALGVTTLASAPASAATGRPVASAIAPTIHFVQDITNSPIPIDEGFKK